MTYGIQGEMKGSNFTKHPKGRKAIAMVLERCASKAKVMVADKKFALAGKLFEYIFEPALSDNIVASSSMTLGVTLSSQMLCTSNGRSSRKLLVRS